MMNPENVFKLYELFMAGFEKNIPGFYYETGTDKLSIGQYLKSDLPDQASGELFLDMPFNQDYIDKIKVIAPMVYQVVRSCTNVEIYDDFRKSYAEVLRIELYRQFISTKARTFEKENAKDLFAEIIEKVELECNKFTDIHPSLSAEHKELIRTMRSDLENLQKNVLNNSIDMLNFEIEANKLITTYQIKTESDLSWAPLFKNLLLLVSLIGTIPAMISMGNKAINGNYTFFDSPVLYKPKSLEEYAPKDQMVMSM